MAQVLLITMESEGTTQHQSLRKNGERTSMAMKKYGGLLLSEWMTAGIVVVVGTAVGFGMYVSNERDTIVDNAQASLAAIKTQLAPVVESAISDGRLLQCDNGLVDADVLENDYLTLSLRPLPINPSDYSEGYLPSIYVSSKKEDDGNEIFDTAKRLHKSMDKEERFTLRLRKKEDDEIAFSIVVSDAPICTDYVKQTTAQTSESNA